MDTVTKATYFFTFLFLYIIFLWRKALKTLKASEPLAEIRIYTVLQLLIVILSSHHLSSSLYKVSDYPNSICSLLKNTALSRTAQTLRMVPWHWLRPKLLLLYSLCKYITIIKLNQIDYTYIVDFMCLLYGNSHIIRLTNTYTVLNYFVKQYTFNICHFSLCFNGWKYISYSNHLH